MESQKKKSKRYVIIPAILVMALMVLGLLAGCGSTPKTYVYEMPNVSNPNPLTGLEAKELPKRPMMVSTDNVGDAIPQYGISQADIVYEVPVEGAQSRLEAIYYSDMPDYVGPCRSVRPYIVDLAREYHAILTHDGWSPDAKAYLEQNVVADIPAQKHSFYYRTSEKEAPHNNLVHTKDVLKAAKEEGYMDDEIDQRSFTFMNEQEQAVLGETQEKYLEDVEKKIKENLESGQDYELPDLTGITAPESKAIEKIKIKYANCTARYKYDSEKGIYTRSVNGGEYRDLENGKEITMNNVIVYKVSSKVLDQKGRLEINMCAGGDAWVFTCGRMIKGTWEKKNLESPTIFKDKDGNEIKLSPGKTWINIIDGDSVFDYE